jgi:hypothetical protein
MRRGQLEQRLYDFDFVVHAKYPGQRFRLVLVGGAALVLLGCLSRSTVDLDALQAPSELTPDELERATRRQQELEALLLAAGGIAGSGTLGSVAVTEGASV